MKKRTSVNNKELFSEIIKSQQQDELTSRAFELLYHLVEGAIQNPTFKDYRDKEDCFQSGLADVMLKWRSFDRNVSENPFAFFTQIAKNGFNKQYNEINKRKGLKKGEQYQEISINQYGDQEIHSI
jgi:DNA-directed RNA polymerase specialized sigma24 family protein